MRICHVITRLIIGGAQENTVLTCRGLVEMGHDVTLIAGPETGPEGSLWDKADASGANLTRLDSLRRAVSPLRDRQAMHDLTAIFRRDRPEFVHTHSSKAGILGRIAARKAGVPHILHTIHGMSFNRTQSFPARSLYRFLEKRAARCTDHFITVADAMIEQAVAGGIAPREKFTTIRSGLETDLFSPDEAGRQKWRSEWNADDDEIVVGTIARLFANKGYEEILSAMPRAVASFQKLRFVWVGDGKHRPIYEHRLDQLGLRDRVTFAGLLPPEQIGSVINGFDILLHASKWEGLPRALVQALLVEKPVISFDNDGAPEVVNEKTGMLVKLGDIAGLTDAIVTLANDSQRCQRLGRAGRESCLAEFDWRHMVDRIDSVYQRL